jgi:hypothetical protein
LRDVENSTRLADGGEVSSLLPGSLMHISVRGCVNRRAIMRPAELAKSRKFVVLIGIEPAAFRPVAEGLSLLRCCVPCKNKNKQTPWSESASELYRLSDRRFSRKWLQTFADKGCHVVSVTDPNGRILGFLDRSRYFCMQ